MASISLRTHAPEITAGVRFSDVYQALAGVKPRRTGSDTWRAPAIWRDGINVSMDDSRGVWHDFKTDDGGGVLALVVQVRGGTRQNALHWLADLTGTRLGDQPFPPAESAKLARERWEFERDLQTTVWNGLPFHVKTAQPSTGRYVRAIRNTLRIGQRATRKVPLLTGLAFFTETAPRYRTPCNPANLL
jgi:hypothetical protein